jgi:hypothetical protein
MHNARDIAQDGQQNIDPEMQPNAYLEEYTQRGQENGKYNPNEIHTVLLDDAPAKNMFLQAVLSFKLEVLSEIKEL